MMIKLVTVMCLLFSGAFAHAAVVEECTAQTMLPLITVALADYAQEIATKRRIDIVPGSLEVTPAGTRDVVDTDSSPAAPSQTMFTIGFKTPRGSQMSFLTPSQGLCKDKPAFCYSATNDILVGLPPPEIKVTRDSEGIVTAQRCVQKSHAGYNRWLLLVNETEQQVVYDELISYEHSVITTAEMPLKQ